MKIIIVIFGLICISLGSIPVKPPMLVTKSLRIHDVYHEKCDDGVCVSTYREFIKK